MQIQQMVDSMLSDRSWLPEFHRKIFMQNSESTRRKKKKKKRKSIRAIQKRRDVYEFKDQIHEAQQRLTSVEVLYGKIERVWKRKENEVEGK